MRSTPRRVLVASAIGTLASMTLVLVAVFGSGQGLARLVSAGRLGPAAGVIHKDLRGVTLSDDEGHDGQQFYAIARAPMHLSEVATSLDRPRYRLQRPLLPWLAWLLHPTGGGPGLVWAMFIVGSLALFVGGVAMGDLIVSGGGSPWYAAVFALLPGAWSTLSIGVADALALALGLAAIALARRSHWVWAPVVAVAAVLSKESIIVLLGGYALGEMTRRSPGWRRAAFTLVLAPLAAAAALWLALHAVPSTGRQIVEIVSPLSGWIRAFRLGWSSGAELLGLVCLVTAIVLGLRALARSGMGSPWSWPIVCQLGFLTVLSADVVGPSMNGARATAPLLALAVVSLASRARVEGYGESSIAQGGDDDHTSPARSQSSRGARGADRVLGSGGRLYRAVAPHA